MQEVSTTSKVKRLVGKFSHTVIGWQGLPRGVGDHIESPEIELCGHKWKLRIFPGGSALKHKKFLSVYLANRSSSSVTASYKLSLRNQNTNVDVDLFESTGVKTFEVQGQGKIDGWGRDRFIDKDALTEDNGYYVNDTIVFNVEVVVYGEIEHHSVFGRNGFTLDQDISTLFHQSINTDLIIKVTGKRFHLHKCILAARSPVFQAMFSYPTAEVQRGIVTLEEDDPTAIESFLEFLYTDFVSEQTLKSLAKELLIVASKYQVSLLIAACEQFLLNSQLTVQSALSMHEFAYIYGTPHFQAEVKLFLYNHLEDIQNCDEYGEMNDGERLFLQNQLDLNNIQLQRRDFLDNMKKSSTGKFQCTIV